MGLRTFMGQNVPTTAHTTGTMFSCVVNGALAAGATSIVFDGAASGSTLKENDIIEIAGYGNAVVAADVGAGTTGTITIREPLTAIVADDTAVLVTDNISGDLENTWECHGAAFHPDAFAFVSAPLDIPASATGSYIQDAASGLSIRAVYDYDNGLKADVLSLDILCGAAMVDGRLGAQIIESTS